MRLKRMAFVGVMMLLLLPGGTTWAQQRVADSLLLVLEKHHREDTVRVNRMNDLAYAVYNNNSTMAEEYAREAGRLSDHLNYKKGKARSLWVLGLAHLGRDKLVALDLFQEALAISERINDRQGMANYLIASGNLYRDLGRYEKGDSCYNRALELAMALGDRQIEIKCLTNIARSHTGKGAYAPALELLQRADHPHTYQHWGGSQQAGRIRPGTGSF